ncbi:MAG: preprotein translocase subunit YajC [Planctomycetota bacterium]|nr:preprotein translocase subunit YajC [Planctomycetota bacterium]
MRHPLTQTFLLQDATGGFMDILPMLGVMFLIFYFLLIRPQNKERRQQQVMRSSLKKGDKVLTQGGIVASIRDVKEKEVVLDIDGAKIRIVRDAVVRVLEAKDAETATV